MVSQDRYKPTHRKRLIPIGGVDYRTTEEREANRHPNRSSYWIPNRLREIKYENTFYFGKPLTRTVEEWNDYTEMNEVVEKIVTKEENLLLKTMLAGNNTSIYLLLVINTPQVTLELKFG